MFNALMTNLSKQVRSFNENIKQIEILVDDHETDSIGKKRNRLLQQASGRYIAFIDSDDDVYEKYVQWVAEECIKGYDCVELNGIYTEDGKNPRVFRHSIKYKGWYEKDDVFYRPPNHLNAVKADIAKQMKFPEINHGEDKDYSMQLATSGFIKTEGQIPQPIYFYNYIRNKNY